MQFARSNPLVVILLQYSAAVLSFVTIMSPFIVDDDTNTLQAPSVPVHTGVDDGVEEALGSRVMAGLIRLALH